MKMVRYFAALGAILAVLLVAAAVTAQQYPAGMLSYWRFDEGSGTTAYDAVGSNDGTINGANWVDGVTGKGLSFDGVDDCVSMDDMSGIADFTQMIWFRPSQLEWAMMFQTSLSQLWLEEEGHWGVRVATYRNGFGGTQYGHYLSSSGDWGHDFVVDPTTLSVESDEWYHLAVTAAADNSEIKAYFNGEYIGSLTHGYLGMTGDYFYGRFGCSAGSRPWYPAPGLGYHFNGVLDEAAVYNRVLTPEEIQQSYQAGVQPAEFLIIDEDSIDKDGPFHDAGELDFFSEGDVNDDIADIGLRTQLPFFAANVGSTITLYTGEVGDEGWFAPKTIPESWDGAGPDDGLRNYINHQHQLRPAGWQPQGVQLRNGSL
jgi:hypothetical protein